MDASMMDAEGGRVHLLERRAKRLVVIVALQNLLVAACLLLTLYAYCVQEPQSKVGDESTMVSSTGFLLIAYQTHFYFILPSFYFILFLHLVLVHTDNLEKAELLDDYTTHRGYFICLYLFQIRAILAKKQNKQKQGDSVLITSVKPLAVQ